MDVSCVRIRRYFQAGLFTHKSKYLGTWMYSVFVHRYSLKRFWPSNVGWFAHEQVVPRDMDVFCVCTQLFLKQRWIICAYEQVPRDMEVFCVRTQIFLKLILAFQRWIICAYEQVPRDMNVFCVRTQIFLKMILAFQRWITKVCAYKQVPRDMDVLCVRTQIFLKCFWSSNSYVSIGNYTHRHLEFLRIYTKNPRLF